MLQHIRAQVVADRIRIPLRASQQTLHAVGPLLTRMFGQLPAVLALHRAEQSIDIPPHPLALLGAREAWPDALLDLVPLPGPGSDFRLGKFLSAPLLLHDPTPFDFRSS
jgi:hypothetical protein